MKVYHKVMLILCIVFIIGAAYQRAFFFGQSTPFSRAVVFVIEPLNSGSKAVEEIFKAKKLKGVVAKTEYYDGYVYLYLGFNHSSDYIIAPGSFFQPPRFRLKGLSSEEMILAILRTGEEVIGVEVVARGEIKYSTTGAKYIIIEDPEKLNFKVK